MAKAPSLRLAPPVKAPKKVRTQELLGAQLPERDLDFGGIIRLMGESAANGDRTDPVIFQGPAEIQMRRMLATYGFERMPYTYGELQALIDYCDQLDLVKGHSVMSGSLSKFQAGWVAASLDVWARSNPETLPAAKFFASGDMSNLRQFHKEQDLLTKLGMSFTEF